MCRFTRSCVVLAVAAAFLASSRMVLASETSAERWWAFQPIGEIAVPAVLDSRWIENQVDSFVFEVLTGRGLAPAAPAPRRAWLRRVTFDLTGLPPTPAELDAYLADWRPGADSRVVDRLLSSPAYGQRWARHWLDVARYADYHNGETSERSALCEPLEAWRYRDWVVESFNRDLAFDRFIYLQIAGDIVPNPDGGKVYPDGLVATTLLANGVWDRDDADKEKVVSDMVDDQIDIVGKAFLGLSLGCARCHDHKFDPISQEDYYALAGMFYSTHILTDLGTKGGQYTLKRPPLVTSAYLEQHSRQQEQLTRLEADLDSLQDLPKSAELDGRHRELERAKEELRQNMLPTPPVATAVQEGGTPGGLFPQIQDVPIHIRGSYRRLGAVVPRRLPAFFAGLSQSPITIGSGRRELADWVTGATNPLTARVIVNRIWQGHFGTGLVSTPNNFGLRAGLPSHPALLDWLSNALRRDDWSLKQLHRSIVLSATYRQASQATGETVAEDPRNKWLARYDSRRLESEAIRDALLFVTGQLDQTHGGPALSDIGNRRRSLYVQTARWDHNTFATLFDAANSDVSTGKRSISTVAPQALFFLNDEFVHQIAEQFAQHLVDERDDFDSRLNLAYRLAFARLPRESERQIARQLLESRTDHGAWADLAHVLLCSNEFIYVD